MYIWAGRGCRTDVVEKLNLSTFTYEQRHITDSSAPDCLYSMAVTWDESHGYSFGGEYDFGKMLNSIYCLYFSTLKCIEIVPATGSDTPTPRAASRMVHFNRKLVVYGGLTNDDGSVSSDLLLFDLDNSKYCKVMCVYVFVSCTDMTVVSVIYSRLRQVAGEYNTIPICFDSHLDRNTVAISSYRFNTVLTSIIYPC